MSKSGSLSLRDVVLREGTAELSDAQLMALLLGKDGRATSELEAAGALLRLSGSLSFLNKLSAELLSVSGVGPAKAARLLAGLELGRRAARHRPPVTRIRNEQDVAEWASLRLNDLEHEEVWVLCLDARHRLKATSKLAQGGLHGCALTAQDVLRPAVRNAASAIVLVHNHPSGDPTPSQQDVATTKALSKACELLGIPLLDHVVVGTGGVCSIATAISAQGHL